MKSIFVALCCGLNVEIRIDEDQMVHEWWIEGLTCGDEGGRMDVDELVEVLA